MIINFILTIQVIALLLASCTSTKNVVIDDSKVIGYKFALEDRKKMPTPYVAEFRKGRKRLAYVLSKHISDKGYPDPLQHPTLVTIRKVFQTIRPDVVIVEGLPSSGELSPLKFVKHSKTCRKRVFKKCGESFYAIDQALKVGAEFVSGEPSDKEILRFVAQSGYTDQDLLGFYLVRQIPQMKRRGQFSVQTFESMAERFLKRYRDRLGMTEPFGYKDFQKWYETHMTKPRRVFDIENNDAAPHGGEDATYVQKISYQVGLARDRMIVKRIETMLNQFDRVLVIYGGSHFLVQESALVHSLGQPIYQRYTDDSHL